MSEEEKEAIDYLENLKKIEINFFADRFITGKVYLQDSEKEKIDKVLNYISKLQKENKELKEELDYYKQKENQDFDERDYYEE